MTAGKTLVYGFGPYEEFERNVSEAIIRALEPDPHVVTEVFDTRFSSAMFLRALDRHSPEIIIGLGQHRRARKLRLERTAVNRWGGRGEPLRPVSNAGPSRRYVNLRLPGNGFTTLAHDAGTYVCNFSMYVCLEYCAKTGGRFAFIHVPKDFDLDVAVAYLSGAVRHARAALPGGTGAASGTIRVRAGRKARERAPGVIPGKPAHGQSFPPVP